MFFLPKKVALLLRNMVSAHGHLYWVYLLAAALAALLELLPPRVLGYFADQVTQVPLMSEVSAQDFMITFAAFGIGVALLLFAINFAWDLFQEAMFLRTEANLRRMILKKLHHMPVDQIDDGQRGDFLTKISQDVNGVERFVAVTLPDQVKTLLLFFGVTVTFIGSGGILAALLLVSALILAYVNLQAQKHIRPTLEQLRTVHSRIMHLLLENYEGLLTIRSLGSQKFVTDSFEKNLSTIIKKGFRLNVVTSLIGGSNGFVTGVLTTVALCFVGWQVNKGHLTVSDALLYPFYIGLFYSSALSTLGMIHSWTEFSVQGGRVSEFLFHDDPPPSVAGDLNNPPKEIALSAVTVQYKGCLPLTDPFDLAIRRCEILLIRGPSGSGKTTLMQMLSGLRPFGSATRLLSAKQFQVLESKGSWVLPKEWSVYVEQRPYLFEGTIRSNLLLGNTRVTESQVFEALDLVNLRSFVGGVGGLDYILRDLGSNLSEGQKYRLIVARALLVERPFYFFDEPFAALDSVSVAAICAAFEHLKTKGCGVIFVSHTIPSNLVIDRYLDFDDLIGNQQNTIGLELSEKKTKSSP